MSSTINNKSKETILKLKLKVSPALFVPTTLYELSFTTASETAGLIANIPTFDLGTFNVLIANSLAL